MVSVFGINSAGSFYLECCTNQLSKLNEQMFLAVRNFKYAQNSVRASLYLV